MDYIKAIAPLLIFLAVSFCIWVFYSKKISKHSAEIIPDDTRPVNSLTLIRGLDYTNYIRKYTVIIDGNRVDEISSGETRHISLAPGVHSISLQIDWCKTAPLQFEMCDGTNITMHCGATYNDWKAAFMAFLKPRKWLYVKVA